MSMAYGHSFQSLAELVRQSRVNKGMTQRQLSRAIGMSEGYVGHLESGRFRPTIKTLKSLATTLGLLYGQLAVETGYLTQEEFDSPIDEEQLARLNEINDLTTEEWESVRDYARFVRSKRNSS